MSAQQQNLNSSHQKAGNLAVRRPDTGKVVTEGGAHLSNYTQAGSRPPISDGE